MQAHVSPSSAAPVGVPPEESPDPVTHSAQSSLARTHAGEATIAHLKADLAMKEYEVEETRGKLRRAEDEQRIKKAVSDEAVAAAMRCEFAKWLREREAMSRYVSCGGCIMLL
jgi:hypothetical protein